MTKTQGCVLRSKIKLETERKLNMHVCFSEMFIDTLTPEKNTGISNVKRLKKKLAKYQTK